MKKLFTSMLIFATSFCFSIIEVKVTDLNTNQETVPVEIQLTSLLDLQKPFQVVYNGEDKFYNNHNNDNELLPIYLYTQENPIRNIALKSELGQLIVYASTTELDFFPLATERGVNKLSVRPLSKTPAWSKLWSSNTSIRGIPSEVSVKYTYDSTRSIITFYFPSIYVRSPPQQPSILSTYTEYLEQPSQVGSEDVY